MTPLLQKHKRSVMIASVAVGLLILASLRFCQNRAGGDYASAKEAIARQAGGKSIPAVQAFTCRKTDFKDNLVLTGNLQGGARVELRFNRDGRIGKINVGVGDKVKKGSLIAELETGEANIKLQQAEAELSQAVDLYRSGVIAKPRLTQARLAAELARKEHARSFLKAPRDGSIGELNAEEGEIINTQTTVATLVSVDTVYVEMGVIEKDLSKLHIGQTVETKVETYPDLTFQGKIARIAPLVEGQSRTRTVRAEVPNPEGLLLPGMFAECRIFIHEKPAAMVVPAGAVRTKEAAGGVPSRSVFAILTNGQVKETPVTTGYESADYTEVLSGLEPETRIIANLNAQIRDAIKVDVVEELAYEPH